MELRNTELEGTEIEETEAVNQKKKKIQFNAKLDLEARTQLNSIIGFSEMIQDGLVGEINLEQKEVINDIIESAKNLLIIISQKFENEYEQSSISSCIHSKVD